MSSKYAARLFLLFAAGCTGQIAGQSADDTHAASDALIAAVADGAFSGSNTVFVTAPELAVIDADGYELEGAVRVPRGEDPSYAVFTSRRSVPEGAYLLVNDEAEPRALARFCVGTCLADGTLPLPHAKSAAIAREDGTLPLPRAADGTLPLSQAETEDGTLPLPQQAVSPVRRNGETGILVRLR